MNDFEPAVREYLRYCRVAGAELKLQGSSLNPKYHPTEAGCCRLVWGDEKLIREAFVKVTSSRDEGEAA